MAKTDKVRLQHILDAAQKAIAFIEGRTREDLDRDEMLALAVVRLIEILGEAAKNVSDSTKARSPLMSLTTNAEKPGFFPKSLPKSKSNLETRFLIPMPDRLYLLYPLTNSQTS